MNDVFAVADRIAALYLGRMAAQVKTTDVTHAQIVELITAGRSGDLGLPPDEAGRRRRRRHHARSRPVTTTTATAGGVTVAKPTVASHVRDYLEPGARRRHGRAARRPRPGRALRRLRASLRPTVLHRRSTSPTCSPRAPRSSSSRWAWSSSCCSARSTCPPASPAASAPPCMAILLTNHGWPWYVAVLAAIAHRRGDRPGARHPGREGRHPVLRGHPGRLPGLPGRRAAAAQGRHQHLDPRRRSILAIANKQPAAAAGLGPARSSRRGYAAVQLLAAPQPGRAAA